MRGPSFILVALAGLALIASAAGLRLNIGGSAGDPDVMSLAGLSGLPRPGIEGSQPLDLAALQSVPPAAARHGRPAPPPPAAAAPHGRPAPVPPAPPPPAEAPVEPAPAAVAAAPVEQPQAPPAPAADGWLDADFAAQVLAVANQERAARGIAPLASNGALTQGAQDYARTLTRLGKLSHVAVGDLSSRVLATGYVGNGFLGEVLWFGSGPASPSSAVAAWLASPGHSALLLDPVYATAGSGCFFEETAGVREGRCVLILAG